MLLAMTLEICSSHTHTDIANHNTHSSYAHKTHTRTQTADSLDAWRQRDINVITWSAVDMLYNQRQKKYFGKDADLPMGKEAAQALLPSPSDKGSSDSQQSQ